MPHIALSPGQQDALASLLAAEPVPGRPLPDRRVLELLDRLIPSDGVGGSFYGAGGLLLEWVDLPSGFLARAEQGLDLSLGTPPEGLPSGIQHLTHLERGDGAKACGIADSLHLVMRNGEFHVVDLWLDRTRRPYEEQDVAVLAMVAPALRRLVRERPHPSLPADLTPQERRVLMLVTAGLSNHEVAERLTVAPSTVRKHLEHCYRKLGVTSRLGAIAALHGADRPDLDLRARLERYA